MSKWIRNSAKMLRKYSWSEPITRRQAIVAAYEDWKWAQGI